MKVLKRVSAPKETVVIDFYVRRSPNEDHILYLAELYEDGVKVDRIIAYQDKNTGLYHVIDGRSRMKAQELLNYTHYELDVIRKPRDRIAMWKLAYNSNVGGALPPKKEDNAFVCEQLLAKGYKLKEIAEILPLSKDRAYRYVQNAISKRIKRAVAQAKRAMAKNPKLTTEEAAKAAGCSLESLRKSLAKSPIKPSSSPIDCSKLRNKFKSLQSSIGQTMKHLLEQYDDGEVLEGDVRYVMGYINAANSRVRAQTRGWSDRLEVMARNNEKKIKLVI